MPLASPSPRVIRRPLLQPPRTETVQHHPDFRSNFVEARNIDVWLPPDYDRSARHYPVLYMHDGQNLFDSSTAFIGVDWGIGETMTRLIAESTIEPAIVVGIWNTPRRVLEYMPQKPLHAPGSQDVRDGFAEDCGGLPFSDNYLRFIVDELKPFIDMRYRTLRDGRDTTIMGSSMGGLVSIYALMEYPEVFSGAGCLSTHWPIGDPAVIAFLEANLPEPGRHRIYFDFGTETLDAQYEPYQGRVDAIMKARGFTDGKDWMTLKFDGEEHSERAWRERVWVPLAFLLNDGV